MSESSVSNENNAVTQMVGTCPTPKNSLTVAIPALNEEKNIEGAVRSVFAAAEKVPGLRVEIIVIDDGSRDKTAEIVRGLMQKYDNVRIIQNPVNIGLGASIRCAIEAASMEKFLSTDADDGANNLKTSQIFSRIGYL
jgi:glycosyltransferase involved in cell wall biosynthesis